MKFYKRTTNSIANIVTGNKMINAYDRLANKIN